MHEWATTIGVIFGVVVTVGGTLVGIAGVFRKLGRFEAKAESNQIIVTTRLDAIDKTMNGPLQKKFDSAAKHNEDTYAMAKATHDAVLGLPCDTHKQQLEGMKEELKVIKAREERQVKRLEAAEDSG